MISSYTTYEKDSKKIEDTIISIKELVSKKLSLLINIIFARDQNSWFTSLKIKEQDSNAVSHFNSLINLTNQMMNYSTLQEIPENLVETFGQTLLSTNELSNQINKLVLKRFE